MPGRLGRSVLRVFRLPLVDQPGLRYFAWAWVAVVIGILLFSDSRSPQAAQRIAEVVALLFALYALERLACYHPPCQEREAFVFGTRGGDC